MHPGVSVTFQQDGEARDQQVKRERLDGNRAYPGAETAMDVPQALVNTAPSAWLGSRQMCQVLPGAGQTSCELNAGLPHPSRNLQLPPAAAGGCVHSFIQACVNHLPVSDPMQDAKNMGVLRTHNQEEKTEMLTDNQTIHEEEHKTLPEKEAIQVSKLEK